MSLAAISTPEALLAALQSQRSARLPIALGRQANDDAGDVAGDELAHHWLVPGGIVELSSLPGAGAWSIAFCLAVVARRRAMATNNPRWIGAVDPSSSLSPMALSHLLHPSDDVDDDTALLETLVVRPRQDALLRTAMRMTRSGACAAVVIDAVDVNDAASMILGLRRLAIAAEEHAVAVILVTSESAHRRQPLPVAARAQVSPDLATGGVVMKAVRHRHGMPPRVVVPKVRLRPSVTADLVEEVSRTT